MSRRSLRTVIALALATLAGCELDGGRPRRLSREEPSPPGGIDAGALPPDGGYRPPGDNDPSVVQSEPVDVGTSQCPQYRLYRVDRRHVAAPPSAPPLRSRFFGRADDGRYVSLRDVLACELESMHFIEKPLNEGIALILLRGPEVFGRDAECEWREPVRTERVATGRRVIARERCRRGASNARGERVITVEVPTGYRALSVR